MSSIFKIFKFVSIKNKVIILISASITVAMLLITLFVILVVNKNMDKQLHSILTNRAHFIHEKLNQRISYLVDNSVLLTKNDLMVNALTDTKGRKVYLPPLVENFMDGKDVSYLNVIDFEGRAIFQTRENIPTYNESEQLRVALAFGELSYYIEKDSDNLVVVSPIEYYNTTQGAAVVVFEIDKIMNRLLSDENDIYIKLIKDKKLVYSHKYDTKTKYTSYNYNSEKPCSKHICFLKELEVSLEIGIPSEVYAAPLKDIIIKLSVVGIFFIIIGIIFSKIIAKNITNPILELYKRVRFSTNKSEMFCSPLGTNDELEELAKAFDERSLMIQHQAQYDILTELPNRVLFLDRLRQSIKNSLYSKEEIALLFIDLDHFKEINDSFGHDFGDKLLIIVGEKLESLIKDGDSLARIGGDEFTILLNNLTSEDEIVKTLQNIMNQFIKPFDIDGHEFYLTCSIGVSVYPINGQTPEELLKNADAAMNKAKSNGRNTYQFYTEDMTEKAYERVVLETQIRQGILNNEFEVYYQPQVNISNEKIVGMEALVRWNHPAVGLISPDNFIPLAEDTGLIVDIDRKVTEDAIKQFKQWLDDGYDVGIISINLSIVQLVTTDFMDFINSVLEKYKLPTKHLMMEVTETQVMKDPEHAISVLNKLKNLGIKLAIDDFGTGYSSLSYLKKLPIDKLKIDQSFIRDVFIDNDDKELTRAIISISKSLNLDIIAEGVETKEQSIFLVENGCNEAQGYLYFKPQTAKEITLNLKR